MTSSRLIVPAVAVLAAAAIGGCGSSSKKKTTSSQAGTSAAAPTSTPTPPAGGLTVKLSADPSGKLAFDKKTLTVSKPGTVTLVMTNPSSSGVKHGIAIEGNGIDKDGAVVDPGGTSTVTVDLKKAGKYEFYCPFDSHKAQGMEGELTVGGAKAASTKPAAQKPASNSSSSGGASSGGSSGSDSGGSSGGGGY